MAVSKVIINGVTRIDATTATATAGDILAPKTAMLADGVMTTGTGTGGGGGISIDDIATNTAPSGAFTLNSTTTRIKTYAFAYKPITSISGDGVTNIETYAFSNCKNLISVDFPNATNIESGYNFSDCTSLTSTGLPYATGSSQDTWNGCTSLEYFIHDVPGIYTRMLRNCRSLKAVDVGPSCNATRADMFNGCSVLTVFVIRRTENVVALPNTSAFSNTPFASGGTGGTLYVPSDLVSSYQSATNWSTILGYTNNQIKSIESTHTDPNAPIDLTLYYADGTLIPT